MVDIDQTPMGPTQDGSAANPPEFAALLRPVAEATQAVAEIADPLHAFQAATVLAEHIRTMADDAARVRRQLLRRALTWARAAGLTSRAVAVLIGLSPARVSQLRRREDQP